MVTLVGDIMFVNNIQFLVTSALTTEYILARTTKHINKVLKLYQQGGSTV